MEHVGAITDEEAAFWRRRLHEAAAWKEPPYEPPSEQVAAHAADHLERVLAPVSPSTAHEESNACFSAIRAYEQTGILSADEALGWRERLRAQRDLEPERPPLCSQREPIRVIAGPAERVDGLRITSIELFADGVVLYWHQARRWTNGTAAPRLATIDREARDWGHGPYPLTDDVGTRYVGGSHPYLGINGGGWRVRFGTSPSTPAVPSHARLLHIPFWRARIDIDLRR